LSGARRGRDQPRNQGVRAIDKGHLIAGRYRLLEHVGSGSMGIVWRARDERLDRTVAIKQLLVRPGRTEEQADQARRRAMREARIAARLQHHNAVVVYDVAEHDGDPCLVLEYLPSRSLSQVITERGSLPPKEAAAIGAEVAVALAAAHAAGIVHRDIKPGNVLIADSGTAKITDFGIARAIDDGTVTQSTGTLAGTPAYLAPEVARGGETSRGSDVFSLGATLYHAVEGEPPFGRAENPLALLYAVAGGQVRPMTKAGPLTPVITSLLRPDPGERPSMEEAAAALAEVASGAKVAALPPRGATRTTMASAPVAAAMRTPQRIPPTPPRPQPALVPSTPPTPARGMARGMAQPPRKAVFNGRLIAVLVAVLVLAGTITAVVIAANKSDDPVAGPTSTPPPSPAQTSSSTAPPTTTTTLPAPVQKNGNVDYQRAGLLIIGYYNAEPGIDGMWAMLTPEVQQSFGDLDAFKTYWAQYPDVSARNARGVTLNEDGSVNVPVDITYKDGQAPQHKVLRVIAQGSTLLIASDGH
jgi:eukaryotic-like serine/threonine-protein kinase